MSTSDPRAGIGVGAAGDPMFTLQAGKQHAVGVLGDKAHTLTAEGHDASEDGTGRGTPVVTYQKVIRSGARDADGNLPPEVWERRDVAATLNLNDLGSEGRAVDLVLAGPVMVHENQRGEITTNSTAGALGTGGGKPGQGYPAVLAPTLTASLGEGGWAGHNRKDEMVERTFEAGATVRRLTPTECERLQGFPDGHTLTSNGKRQSDAQRYKQMGNAVAVPVFEWVARRLAAVDATTSVRAA